MSEYGVKLHCKSLMIELVERCENESMLDFCYRAIGCGCIDILEPENLDKKYCMVVDDEGLLVEHPCLNAFASHIYGTHIHGQPIAGNAVILKNSHDEDGRSLAWLSREEAVSIANEFGGRVLSVVAELNAAISKGVI